MITLEKIAQSAEGTLPEDRKQNIRPIIDYVRKQISIPTIAQLNFICTHNSRRSHLAQVWAQVAADFYKIPAKTFSAGVEVTAFHPNAVRSFEELGFIVKKGAGENPIYQLTLEPTQVSCFSKNIDDASLPADHFAAIMVCDDADENCPFLPGADVRIPLRYVDPKRADGTAEERAIYRATSLEIAHEMFYLFSQIK